MRSRHSGNTDETIQNMIPTADIILDMIHCQVPATCHMAHATDHNLYDEDVRHPCEAR